MTKTPPPKGEASLAGVFPFAAVSGPSPLRLIVVVVVVAVVVDDERLAQVSFAVSE